MLRNIALVVLALFLGAASASAHHGWGSYDAGKPVTVAGRILTSKYESPHVTLAVQGADKVWTVTLAPTSRMINRGALLELAAAGRDISACGYPSAAERGEMR